jgi:hypothetical protein
MRDSVTELYGHAPDKEIFPFASATAQGVAQNKQHGQIMLKRFYY